MKNKNIASLTLLIFLAPTTVSTISVVYNFRIAQITKQPITTKQDKHPYSLTALLFNLFQETYVNNIHENYCGGLVAFNYNIGSSYYIRTDFAVSHFNQVQQQVRIVEETESDDILVTFGRNFQPNDKSRVTLSGLVGVPTHSPFTLQRIPFGSGQVGVGIQLDGLYKLAKKTDFLWGTRYNYFIPRTAQDALENHYKFTTGSIADLLAAIQTSFSLAHGLEGGYAARWGFGARAWPVIPILARTNYQRNSFYLVYKYTILTPKTAQRLLFDVTYGFDSRPKELGYKNAVMVWAAWGMNF